jgi:ankyrin repeat protein
MHSSKQQAARTGLSNAVAHLLDLGIDMDEKDVEAISPTCHAAMEGHTAIVVLLCEHGAEVEAKGRYYGNPMQAACYRSNMEVGML